MELLHRIHSFFSPTIMSLPFIKIVSDKLSLQTTLPLPDDVEIRVVSILGKARMGKSTFLNAIVSKLTKHSVKPFATQDSDEHCTRGIDAFYCAEQGLLLLDCQGLALEDSSHDPALLLFAYLVSDLIIFNERMMLQNEALKLMEPICTFMTYLSMDDVEKQKPRLYFRISDCEILKDDAAAARNLHKVVKVAYKDQYQSIRDSITTLFHPTIGIVKTEPLDKGTKAKLAKDNFLALFDDPSLGFEAAISEILSELPAGRPGRTWKALVPQLVESINRNEKITIDKLDVVGAVGKLELLEWIAKVPPPLFSELPADGLHSTYLAYIEPREKEKQKLLLEFNRKFKNISDTIKTPEYEKLEKKLEAPIRNALERMRVAAVEGMRPFTERAVRDYCITVSNTDRTFTSMNDAYWNSLLEGHRELEITCTKYYEPVREKWENWLRYCKKIVQTEVNSIKAEEKKENEAMEALCAKEVAAFRASSIATIAAFRDCSYALLLHPTSYAKTQIAAQIAETAEKLRAIPQYHSITVAITNRVLTATVASNQIIESRRYMTSHNAVKSIFEGFKAIMEDPALEKQLSAAATKRKEELLVGRSLDRYSTTRIPDVEFIHMTTEVAGSRFITRRTMSEYVHPVVHSVLADMEKEGLLLDGDIAKLCPPPVGATGSNIVAEWSIGKHPEPALMCLFNDLHARAIVKERVKKGGSLYVRPLEPLSVPAEPPRTLLALLPRGSVEVKHGDEVYAALFISNSPISEWKRLGYAPTHDIDTVIDHPKVGKAVWRHCYHRTELMYYYFLVPQERAPPADSDWHSAITNPHAAAISASLIRNFFGSHVA